MNEKTEFLDKSEAKIYLLYMLRKIFDITESENIPIYASGGTCLGMMRHKGIIPWDDDIDLMIFRKDYEKFVKACEKNLKSPIVIRTRENDKFHCEEFAKICLLDDDGNYTDLSIDIFELDETNPERKKFREFQSFCLKRLYFIKKYKATLAGKGEYRPGSLKAKIGVGFFARIFTFNFIEKCFYKLIMGEKKQGDYVVNWGASYSYKKATYPKIAFGTPQKMPFENTYMWAEEHPEMILERLYGKDYMTPPPKDKQIDHGVRKFKCTALDYENIKKEIGM